MNNMINSIVAFKSQRSRLLLLAGLIWIVIGVSCKKKDESFKVERDDLGSIYASFSDGSGFFNPEGGTPYENTIVFVFPTHYPFESDNPIDIREMQLNVNHPSKLEVSGNPSGKVNLLEGSEITITKKDGTSKKYFVKGEIRKSSHAEVLEFSLPDLNLVGHVLSNGETVGLIKGGSDLNNQKPIFKISTRASISPSLDQAQNFNEAVEYTITAEDGVTQKKVTVRPVMPEKVSSGIRAGSGRLLWTKKLSELGINDINHFSTSIAVSEGNLIVNTRESPNKILNRFNGALVGEMVMGDIVNVNFQNFYSTNDDAGSILISNLVTAKGNNLFIYKWKNAFDSNPEKLIEWELDESWQAGRKMSIAGDLDKDALIFLGASNSNNAILRWQVTNGQLVSQIPTKLVYPGSRKWTLNADAISIGPNIVDPLFISGSPSDIAYWDAKNNVIESQLNLAAHGFNINHSIDLAKFNGVNYLGAVSISTLSSTVSLFNVQDPLSLVIEPSSPNYSSFLAYKSNNVPSNSNGNSTGDVLLEVSDDGYKMIMYFLVTNGSIEAYEFDCVNFESL